MQPLAGGIEEVAKGVGRDQETALVVCRLPKPRGIAHVRRVAGDAQREYVTERRGPLSRRYDDDAEIQGGGAGLGVCPLAKVLRDHDAGKARGQRGGPQPVNTQRSIGRATGGMDMKINGEVRH